MRYTNTLADSICERIANGESLRSVCRDDKMPAMSTVFRWVDSRPNFREQYARAKQTGLEAMAEDILAIADTPQIGEKRTIKPLTITDKDGNKVATGINIEEVTTGDMIEHRRLQVDTRKWLMSKLAPKKYGDKLDVNAEHSGTVTVEITRFGQDQAA